MDGETPSWLEEGGDSPAPAAPEPSPPPAAAPAPSADAPPPASDKADRAAPAPAGTTDNVAVSISDNAADSNAAAAAANAQDEKDLPKIIFWMRVLNMAASVLLITTSILRLTLFTGVPVSVYIMAIYATCGGLLVCCLETQLKMIRTVIAMNFGFLFNSVYRAVFYCLMASVTWSYGWLLAYITSITLGCAAVFNTFVLCRYPAYRRMREQIAAAEDRRIQAKINQQVGRQAANQMGWGGN